MTKKNNVTKLQLLDIEAIHQRVQELGYIGIGGSIFGKISLGELPESAKYLVSVSRPDVLDNTQVLVGIGTSYNSYHLIFHVPTEGSGIGRIFIRPEYPNLPDDPQTRSVL